MSTSLHPHLALAWIILRKTIDGCFEIFEGLPDPGDCVEVDGAVASSIGHLSWRSAKRLSAAGIMLYTGYLSVPAVLSPPRRAGEAAWDIGHVGFLLMDL